MKSSTRSCPVCACSSGLVLKISLAASCHTLAFMSLGKLTSMDVFVVTWTLSTHLLDALCEIVLSADIREEFVAELCNFVQELLAPENLIVKKIGGQQIKAKDVINYFKVYIKLFQFGYVPEVKSIFQVLKSEPLKLFISNNV
jgi:hypothetical protein